MYKTIVSAALALLISLIAAYGQEPAGLSFEVASIKPAEPITPAVVAAGKLHVGVQVKGTTVDIGYLSLADILPIAFNMKSYQISGPDWMSGQRFDILAKMPEGATKEQMPGMLRALLEERFQLKFHRENREHAVYVLVVGKGGSKLNPSPPDPEVPPADAPNGGLSIGKGASQVRVNREGSGATVVSAQGGTTKVSMAPGGGQMRMEMSKMTMPGFADMLTRLMDRPVLDMTELKGNFQVALDISIDNMLAVAKAAGMAAPGPLAGADPNRLPAASDPSGSSVFASVQQLGLRLEPRKAPVEFVVIDHLEKTPSEN